MNRIQQLDPAQATGKTKQLFDAAKARMGAVPNLVRALGNSPAALESYLNFNGTLAHGAFSPRVREQISLAVAEANLCDYCLSAHTFVGGKLGLSNEELLDARKAVSRTPKTDAILKLARNIVLERGEVSDAEIADARAAGLDDGEIVETVANVVVNIFTNYVNHVARTQVDFPEVKAGQGLVDSTAQTR